MDVLIVEDNPSSQRLANFQLVRLGVKTIVCADGLTATEIVEASMQAEASTIDAVLMDIGLPLMDGYEATRRIRNFGYRGRVIAITAHIAEHTKQQSIDAGCDEYLTKPFCPDALFQALLGRSEAKLA